MLGIFPAADRAWRILLLCSDVYSPIGRRLRFRTLPALLRCYYAPRFISEAPMNLISARQIIRNPSNYSANVVLEAAARLFDSVYATLDDIRSASRAIAALSK
jgi:hypothetical protein